MTLIAPKDTLIVKPLPADNTSKGGIVLPNATQRPQWCEVVSSGNKNIKAGTAVLVPAYCGHSFDHEGEELLAIKDDGILALTK